MKNKPSIQRAILKKLVGKQAVSLTEIKENIMHQSPQLITTPNPLLNKEGRKKGYAIARSIKNLLTDGLVESFNTEHKQYIRLTKEGKQKLNNIALECESSLVSTTWDGYWRIILLDIPEERKSEREALRYLLKKAGFICLKNSVWISMYPYEHLFTNIKNDLNLTTEMMIIVTNKIDEATEKEFYLLCGLTKN